MSDPNVVSTSVGAPDSAPAPATATPVAPPAAAPTQAAPPPSPAISGQPSNGAPPPGYVPSFRIRETRDQYEAKIASMETANSAKIEQLTRQLQALTGVTPQNRSEEEVIREQLFKVVPDLQKLVALREQLEGMASQREDLVEQNKHYWDSYNRTQMDKLYKAAEGTYGNALTDGQRNYLKAAFVGWASNDPDLAARYQTDPSLIEEFWREFSSSFIEPARRQATANVATRVPANLPQDNPSGALRTSPVPEQDKSLDGTVDRAWATFKQLRTKV